ncbi:MAG TPA: hypothetical protein VFG20_03685 [Planctomycetaceae bacterium]|nr:hypothetical protein [Planctomycetaceae bacterium]
MMERKLPRRIAWFAPWTWKRRSKIAVTIALSVVAYPLSYGPAILLLWSGWMTPAVFEALYQPLWTAAQRSGLNGWLVWYATFFSPISD